MYNGNKLDLNPMRIASANALFFKRKSLNQIVKGANTRNSTASKTTDNFSLISSISIKPIEIWLLCNLAYPFIIIIVNIMIQVTRSPIKS